MIESPTAITDSTELGEEDRAHLAQYMEEVRMANYALNTWVQRMNGKYQIHPPDQLVAGGRIIRAPKPEPSQVGSKAAHRRPGKVE